MFSFKLYKEGLRRSLFIAALFTAIMMLGAVLIPIAGVSSQMRAMANGWSTSRWIVEGLAENFILFLAPIAFAPIITLYQFAFLNRRASVDFYHAIPHKRESLYLSFTAAILTWVVGAIWLCTIVSLVIYALFPAYFIINFSSVFLVTLGLTAGAVLVVAATLLAMSVTGTAFSNIVTALLILFLPRTILTAFTEMVIWLTEVVTISSFGILGNYSSNIAFGFIMNLFGDQMNDMLIQGTLYTAILALLYLGAAMFLFKRRKSETAGNPAQNGIVQSGIRIALAFAVCLPAIAIILDGLTRGGVGAISGDFFGLIAIYSLAIIAYFAYELITTRRIASLKRALPGLLILVVLNIAFLGGVFVARNVILDRNFDPVRIESVRLQDVNQHHWRSGSLSYEELHARQIRLEDPAIVTALTDALAVQVADIRSGYTNRWRGVSENHQWITVFFHEGSGRAVERRILLTNETFLNVMQALGNHPEYAAAFLNLPEDPTEVTASWISEEAAREVFEVLREEVRALSLAEWQQALNSWQFGWSELDGYGDLRVQGFIGNESFFSVYPITSLTPRAAALLVQHINAENYADIVRVLEFANTADRTSERWDWAWPWIVVSGRSGEHGIYHTVGDRATDFEVLVPLLLEAVRAQGTAPLDPDKQYLGIQVSFWDEEIGESVGGYFLFHTDNEELLEALGIMVFVQPPPIENGATAIVTLPATLP